MAPDRDALLADLRAEHADLDRLVAGADLDKPTPAEGWTIGDTVAHLWFFDREATTALVDPDGFTAALQLVIADPDAYAARSLDEGRRLGSRLPEVWRGTRAELLDALAEIDPGVKVPWFGPPMSPASFATARLMEYWAHGQDVADALGVTREPTNRLRHICHLGVRTRGFSYAVRGMAMPAAEVFVSLTGPSGDTWTWGPAEAADRVDGAAADFCLVVTQRRHVADTALRV
ncbi:MAG: TIGR03084 family protein, partial [Frankiales bacterium]|nr:TIGR03084 family protein [Frankiales bacterium]